MPTMSKTKNIDRDRGSFKGDNMWFLKIVFWNSTYV